MAEGKVRLVRCPNCENVLPELSYYSVYQCGGCGAVLRAKSRSLKAESIPVGIAEIKKEDDEVQKSDYFSEKATLNVTDASNPTGFEVSGGESVTATPAEEEEELRIISPPSNVLYSSRSMEVAETKLDSEDPSSVITTPLISTKKLSTKPINEEDDSHISTNLSHSSHHSERDVERDVLMNQEEQPKLLNNQGASPRKHETMASLNKIERATLLRKVEELKEKLTQTCDLVDKQREEAPSCGRRMVHMGLTSPPGLLDASFQFYNRNQMNPPSSCYNTELHGDNISQLRRISPNSAPCHHENHHLPPSHISSCSNPCSQYTCNATIPCSCSCVHRDQGGCPVARGLPCGGFSDVRRNLMQENHPPRCSNQNSCCYDVNGRCGRRHLRPVAGAAPFITCCHCFELLQIPNRVIGMWKGKKMVRVSCGCCSRVMVISMVNQRVVVSADVEIRQHNPPPEVNGNHREGCGGGMDMRRGNINLCYSGGGDSGYDFQWADGEPISSVGFNSGKSEDMHSSSRCTSFNEEFQDDGAVLPLDVVDMTELGMAGASLSPPPPGSPAQEQLEQGRFGRGNRSTRCDQEKVKTMKKTSRQNSLKESELEIPISDYPDIITPHDSKPHQVSSSFFAGIIKKGFRDFSKYNHAGSHGKSYVDINGHAISHRAVRKAERMAGPIYPGKYWYDMKAGFWGVMGGPCLGIISPYIEEFNYPMAVECSGGNTLVFVNGRELHKKDMDLLTSRGLPTQPHMSYSIDISGKLVDLHSGVELHGLGKLAPTVEKMKRGFGMKVPMAPV